MKQLDIGIVGLAVMGRSLALNMADHGFLVGGFNRNKEVTKKVGEMFPHENLSLFFELRDLVSSLKRPRKVMLMIKAGDAVDGVISQLIPLLDSGDIILDGGNSFFEDTQRRAAKLKKKGFIYFGVGVSGGEEGARRGPSVMVGGDKEAYGEIQPLFEAIAAKAADQKPCCAYMGPGGAGHYVKMVHNGIEYADMQLIAEAYLLLKYGANFTNRELASLFDSWQAGELQSFLIKITAEIFREKDDLAKGELLDHILDSAEQKGTGRLASIEALKQGVDISMITAACNARVMSGKLSQRRAAPEWLRGISADAKGKPARAEDGRELDNAVFARTVGQALYAGKIIAYAQGFALMQSAKDLYSWELDLGTAASIFRAGCIIQAKFLDDITRTFRTEGEYGNLLLTPFFSDKLRSCQTALREIIKTAVSLQLPAPAFLNAVSYLDSFFALHSGANLIEAQRDYFGAHTFFRTDREGVFHHEWGKGSEIS